MKYTKPSSCIAPMRSQYLTGPWYREILSPSSLVDPTNSQCFTSPTYCETQQSLIICRSHQFSIRYWSLILQITLIPSSPVGSEGIIDSWWIAQCEGSTENWWDCYLLWPCLYLHVCACFSVIESELWFLPTVPSGTSGEAVETGLHNQAASVDLLPVI